MLIFSKDYYMTKYAAEVVNTLTNLLFIYLGIKGIRNCIKNKHDTVYLIAFLGYLLVGTGSFLFHSTLKCAYCEALENANLEAQLTDSYVFRSNATCRRTLDDIHHMSHVLCVLFFQY
jgi:ascorbate-specific PTS system EIIC-type component UlaA